VSLQADRVALTKTLDHLGTLSPVGFSALQILQVVIAPIPGEFTGLVVGFVFGQWWGFCYSTIGLTIGSLAAFGVGRSIGTPLVKRLVGQRAWDQLGRATEPSGRLLCFVVFLVPGLPKDMACYVFGISRMLCRCDSCWRASLLAALSNRQLGETRWGSAAHVRSRPHILRDRRRRESPRPGAECFEAARAYGGSCRTRGPATVATSCRWSGSPTFDPARGPQRRGRLRLARRDAELE